MKRILTIQKLQHIMNPKIIHLKIKFFRLNFLIIYYFGSVRGFLHLRNLPFNSNKIAYSLQKSVLNPISYTYTNQWSDHPG